LRQYVKYLVTIALLTVLIFECIVIGIIKFPGGVFYPSYQNVIVDKYRILQNINEPKIIVVSGSSSSFGLDQKMLEEETGYKVANMGLHAGFGQLFYSELAKENIKKGDIVLFGYEYGWEHGFKMLGQDLIMSGIDDQLDMYKHIPVSHWRDFVGYIFKYAATKESYEGASGIYSREAFDSETGQMTMEREYEMDYPNNVDLYGKVDLGDVEIDEDVVEYLKEYKQLIEKKGASAYFIAPPVLKQAIVCSYDKFDELKQLEEEKIGIPFISDPEEYFYEDKLMSNALYHCSTEGEKIRTKMLIDDLKDAKVIRSSN